MNTLYAKLEIYRRQNYCIVSLGIKYLLMFLVFLLIDANLTFDYQVKSD